ncbi:MAG: 30S ribosomal protein S1 [Actinobacteria bacterium]|nr:30S ribosomal protein S1 [Actinomycetota bacterium]
MENTDESIELNAEDKESLASLGLSPEDGQEVPDYDGTIKIFNEGDIVEGTVVKVDKEEVLVDIGFKSEGVIPARELSIRYNVKPSEVVATGDSVEALVLQKEDKEGRLILSRKRAKYEKAWGRIENIKEEDGVVEGEVIEVVKGGLIMDIGLRGFLPASLVEMRRVKDLNQFLGQTLKAKVIELDKNRNNVVLSRRSYLEKQKSTERKEFLEKLTKGSRHTGTVSSIVNFGAFVDLGGVDGLIHISELSWSHVDHPSEVLEVGGEVEVEILEVDLERERVSLSMKKAQEDPWETLSKQCPAGSTIHGKVTKIVPFGAFVEIAPGVEGLIHISELAWEHIEFPEEVVSVDEEIDAKIVDIDLDRRRISLSLKQLTGPGEVELEEGEAAEKTEKTGEPELVSASEEGQLEEAEAKSENEGSVSRSLEVVKEARDLVMEAQDIENEIAANTQAVEIEQDVEETAPAPVELQQDEETEPEPVAEAEETVVEVEEAAVEEEPPAVEAEEAVVEAEETTADEEETGTSESEEEPASDSVQGEELTEDVEDIRSAKEDGSLESILADMKKKGQTP